MDTNGRTDGDQGCGAMGWRRSDRVKPGLSPPNFETFFFRLRLLPLCHHAPTSKKLLNPVSWFAKSFFSARKLFSKFWDRFFRKLFVLSPLPPCLFPPSSTYTFTAHHITTHHHTPHTHTTHTQRRPIVHVGSMQLDWNGTILVMAMSRLLDWAMVSAGQYWIVRNSWSESRCL